MKKLTVILIWGAITGIAWIVFNTILWSNGMVFSGQRWISQLIEIMAITIGTIEYRKANGGYLSYGKGYGAGFLMSLISTVFVSIYLAVQLKMNPNFLDNLIYSARSGVTEQQIITMRYNIPHFTPLSLFVWSDLVGLLVGAVLCLITAAITMKKKPIFEEADKVSESIPQA